MAYTNIPDAELEPGKPGSSELFFKLRDNPEAVRQGLPGAPKILQAALNNHLINYDKMAVTVPLYKSGNVTGGGELILNKGFVTGNIICDGDAFIEHFISGQWLPIVRLSATHTNSAFCGFSSGSDMRIRNASAVLCSYDFSHVMG